MSEAERERKARPAKRRPARKAAGKPAAKAVGAAPGERVAKVLARAGVASRREVERMIEEMMATGEVWFATMEDIANHVLRCRAEGGYVMREDHLPYYDASPLPESLRDQAD